MSLHGSLLLKNSNHVSMSLLQKHLPAEIAQAGIHPIYFCAAYYIEMLMKAEMPLVFSAFRMSGFTPSQVILDMFNFFLIIIVLC